MGRFRVRVGGSVEEKIKFFDAWRVTASSRFTPEATLVGVEDAGLAHGFGHEGFGGEVHDGVNFVPGETVRAAHDREITWQKMAWAERRHDVPRASCPTQ